MGTVQPDPTNALLVASTRDLLEHTGTLRRLAWALVHDESVAEDLVQDAFQVAGTREIPAHRLGAFLAGTVRRLALRH